MMNYDFFKKNGNLNIIKINAKTPKQEAIYPLKTDPPQNGQNMPRNGTKRLPNGRFIDPRENPKNHGWGPTIFLKNETSNIIKINDEAPLQEAILPPKPDPQGGGPEWVRK